MESTMDVVCGMNVTVKESTPLEQYNGKNYYFCCEGCKNQFKKNPEKFVKQKTEHVHRHNHNHR